MWSDLPQVPSRWTAGKPRCLQCRHLRIEDGNTNFYGNAFCSLQPSYGCFDSHWVACRRFEPSELCSRIWNERAKGGQRR